MHSTASVVCTMWKHSKIIPIPKADKTFRPIAILPYFSKVFERLIHSQMAQYLYDNNLITTRQSGFRPKHSCITALIDVSEDLRSKLDKNMITFLILLDHSKAFDTVDHLLLCHKLQNLFNFSTTASKLISSYLANRIQSVHYGQEKSCECTVKRGVPQGSILGPLLYTIYSNDLPSRINHCNIHMYADDVQLYISVYNWATANGLYINAKKSKCIVIGKPKNMTNSLPPLTIGKSQIDYVQHAKNLGIVFNEHLDWSNHISAICGRTQSMLRNLWKTQFFTPFKIRMLLAKTYLLPTLMYGCELFAGLDSISKQKLNVTFNNVTRYIYKRNRYSNITHLSKLIFNVSMENFLKCRILILFHKIIYTKQPEYLSVKIQFSRSNRGNKINTIRYRKLISERHFFVNAIRLWNQLPPTIQIISNATQFRKAIFRHIN